MKRGLRELLHNALSQVVRDEMAESRRLLAAEREADFQRAELQAAEQREGAAERELHRDAALAQALTHLASSINDLTSRLESDTNERALLADSVEWMMRELVLVTYAPQVSGPSPSPAPKLTVSSVETLHGGTIDEAVTTSAELAVEMHELRIGDEIVISSESAIDLRELLEAEELVVGTRVEVRSRFQQAWIHGFEILEVIGDIHNRHYRLSRLSDRMALPVLFGHDDIRMVPVRLEPEDSNT